MSTNQLKMVCKTIVMVKQQLKKGRKTQVQNRGQIANLIAIRLKYCVFKRCYVKVSG